MNSFLAMLLKLFGNSIDLPSFFAKLAASLLDGVEDSSGCKERLLQLLRSNTLDDEIKRNPLGMLCCMLHVVLLLADKAGVHVHSVGFAEDPWLEGMANALDIPAPKGGDLKGSLVVDLIIQQLVAKIFQMLKDSNLQQKLIDLINSLLKSET